MGANDSMFGSRTKLQMGGLNFGGNKTSFSKDMQIGGQNVAGLALGDSRASFGSRFVDHNRAKQVYLEREDFVHRQRIADAMEDHDHDNPFMHQVRTDFASINKQQMRISVRNRKAFHEEAVKIDERHSPKSFQTNKIPVQYEAYITEKSARRVTKNQFHDDHAVKGLLKANGQHFSQDVEAMMSRNENVRKVLARQTVFDKKKLMETKKARLSGDMQTMKAMVMQE